MRKWAQFVLLGLSTAATMYGLDPRKPIEHYKYQIWEEAQGLPHFSINALAQSGDGYLWLATYYGLVRFDGL